MTIPRIVLTLWVREQMQGLDQLLNFMLIKLSGTLKISVSIELICGPTIKDIVLPHLNDADLKSLVKRTSSEA